MISVLISILLSVLQVGLADGDPKIYAHKIFKDVATFGDVHIMVHSNGHLIGNRYIIEVIPDCQKTGLNWRRLPIKASESTCQVDRNGIELDRSSQEVTVRVFGMDREKFQKELMSNPTKAVAQCLKESTFLKFDLKDLCAEK